MREAFPSIAQTVRYLSYPCRWNDETISISGRLQLPQAFSGPIPAVIILHGSAGVSSRGMVGAVTLSRVMSDPVISDKLLLVARKAVLELGERFGAE